MMSYYLSQVIINGIISGRPLVFPDFAFVRYTLFTFSLPFSGMSIFIYSSYSATIVT